MNPILVPVMAAALTVGVIAQGAATKALRLDNLGREHLDIIVPDPAASAGFYARIFRAALHQQPVRDTLRYVVLPGDLPADRQVRYVAIGAAGGRAPAIGHYACGACWNATRVSAWRRHRLEWHLHRALPRSRSRRSIEPLSRRGCVTSAPPRFRRLTSATSSEDHGA